MLTNRVRNLAATVALVALSAPAAAEAASGPENTLIDLAVQLNAPGSEFEGAFDTLLAAVLVADTAVLNKLNNFGQHTVFAPTDDAFAALGIDASNIATVDQAALTQILLYHIAQGRLNANAVLARERIKMSNNERVEQSGGVLTDVTGGQATIIVTDQRAENGIVHAIDAVILPFEL